MITVGLLYGGNSPEYDISLRSARTVLRYLDKRRFRLTTVHVTRTGQWVIQVPEQPPVEYSGVPPSLPCEVVLSMMHGVTGEDGAMQGLLTMWNMPYVGSGIVGSALGIDKILSKQLVVSQGVANSVPFVYFQRQDWHTGTESCMAAIDALGYPIFVKPSNGGSSVGIRKVSSPATLPCAVQVAFQYSDYVILEKALAATREIEVGVLATVQDGTPLVSVPGEVVTQHAFYSYEAKYLDTESTTLKIPAPLSIEQTGEVQEVAQRIFKTLRLKHMARIDFFLSVEGLLYFNEVNTLPGFTGESMYPKLWQASGKNLTELLSHLIELALRGGA